MSTLRTEMGGNPPPGRRRSAFAIVAAATLSLWTLVLSLPAISHAAPSCEVGPKLNAATETIVGTDCSDLIVVSSKEVETVIGGDGDDVIFVNGDVSQVNGGSGEDHIYGELLNSNRTIESLEAQGFVDKGSPVYRAAATAAKASAAKHGNRATASTVQYGGAGNQVLVGGPSEDWLYGQRGNDTLWGDATLHGENSNDLLSGGPGDDNLYGENGWDILEGGFGADYLDGGDGNDMVRGDGSGDTLEDTGPGSDVDTLSYSTATAPGFVGALPFEVGGFPAEWAERGVYIRLDASPCSGEGGYEACNGDAAYGGGYDQVASWEFENVIGSPFADVIIGNASANRIDGGGGADAIYGSEGADVIVGGADGDYIEGGGGSDTAFGLGGTDNCITESKSECEGEAAEVHVRNSEKISVGLMQNTISPQVRSVQVYAVGSNGHDSVHGVYWWDSFTSHFYVSFEFEGSSAEFDTSSGAQTPGCTYFTNVVNCQVPAGALVDSIQMSGLPWDDGLNIYGGGIGEYTSTVLTGGTGSDVLWGSQSTEDVLIDGDSSGNDWMYGANWDDVLVNNAGADTLQGGEGNDLLISNTVCDGDGLYGATTEAGDGAGKNSASWAKLPASSAVAASLESHWAGNFYSGGPTCTFGSMTWLSEIDDLEGSNQADVLIGNGSPNGILGRLGNDSLQGRAGVDVMQAGSSGNAEGADYVEGGSPNPPLGSDSCETDASDTVVSCP